MSKDRPGLLTQVMRVDMRLRDVLYISFIVPAFQIRPLVPPFLPIAVIGESNAFISVVALRSEAVHLAYLPFPQFTYDQINIRTYVCDPVSGQMAVYFLHSAVSSSLISVMTRSLGLSWEHRSIVRYGENVKRTYPRIHLTGKWSGDFIIEAELQTTTVNELPFFPSVQAGVDYLVRPLIGFFGKPGSIKRFNIWHPPVEPQNAVLKNYNFPLLHEMNLQYSKEIWQPHSALFVPEANFSIYLPPHLVKDKMNGSN